MKTKLLRKIRKQYSIVYYPKGSYDSNTGETSCWSSYLVSKRFSSKFSYKSSKKLCLDWIMQDVRLKYGNKLIKKDGGIKVWYV